MSARAAAMRGLVLPGVLSLAALAILIVLGTWQMQRLQWKEALIAAASARSRTQPVALPSAGEWRTLDLASLEYRPVTATGTFRHENEVQVYTVLSEPKGKYSGAGYWVLTPLDLGNGNFVVVNRGFVPPEFKDPATRKERQPAGIVTVTGLLRAPEQANAFTPANDAARGVWYRRDPSDIAQAFGLANVAPFLIDATANYRAGALPQPNETKLTFTNNHLGYALTWYGLACTLVGVFGAFAWQRLKSS